MFCFVKDLIFKLNRKVEKGERNNKITRKSKSKAILLPIYITRDAKDDDNGSLFDSRSSLELLCDKAAVL